MRLVSLALFVAGMLAAGLVALSKQGGSETAAFQAPDPKMAELTNLHPSDICRVPLVPDVEALASLEGDDELPINIDIGPHLRLIDQHGERQNKDTLFNKGVSFVFFGYASCEGVCLLAIPSIAEAAELINERQGRGTAKPVMITIDPERDTKSFLKSQLAHFSEDYIGLTGPESALRNARRMFNVKVDPVFEDEKGTVYQHGSFIFVVNAEAEVVSMLPPILSATQIADIAEKYL